MESRAERMTVNPYESPSNEPFGEGAIGASRPRTVSQCARFGSFAGAFAGATYGAVVGASIGFVCVAYSLLVAPDYYDVLVQQSFVFGIGLAIVGTMAGICNGAVVGIFDGILWARLGERFKARMTAINVIGLGWVTGYQAFFESQVAMNYLANLLGTSTVLGTTPIVFGVLIGGIGGVLTALSLVRTLAKVLSDSEKVTAT